MKKFFYVACCVLGSVMVGFFANHLNTTAGSLLFVLGIVLLVISIISINKQERG